MNIDEAALLASPGFKVANEVAYESSRPSVYGDGHNDTYTRDHRSSLDTIEELASLIGRDTLVELKRRTRYLIQGSTTLITPVEAMAIKTSHGVIETTLVFSRQRKRVSELIPTRI